MKDPARMSIQELERRLTSERKQLAARQKTVAAGEELLAQKKARLAELQEKQAELSPLLQELGVLLGGRIVSRKPRQGRSLRKAVQEAFSTSSEPLTAAAITEAVVSSGYESRSKNFIAMVRQVLYVDPDIVRVGKGKFRLKD